ncbi:hypothetical protein CBS101457_005557 [Exobasidium rhododendri]|nr:hypothetical protein CBS101457_005557 [Exobasidium rhododendri]
MVLLVKLKNPNRRSAPSGHLSQVLAAASPAGENESSQEYKSAIEEEDASHAESGNDDSALDDLTNALERAQIKTVDVETLKERRSPTRPAVDVLLAPAVLGHRWVRTRSNSFVVERPERVRAVSLGIAAIAGKHQSQTEKDQLQLDDLTGHLATLTVEGDSAKKSSLPLAVLLSQKTLSLTAPNAALKMIHALDEEYLFVEEADQTVPPSFSSSTISYSSFLEKLCSQAPHEVPPAAKSTRIGLSPVKVEGNDHSQAFAESHPSEIPAHLPQGDLYLCGPRETKSSSSLHVDATSTGNAPLKEGTTVVLGELPHTSEAGTPKVSLKHDEGKEAWLKGGSRGAIEAALGTACAAVDRVVCASLGIHPDVESSLRSIDIQQLHQTGSKSKKDDGDAPTEPALRSFVLVRPPGHHCNATQPSGFCWVNNVAVMAAHAYKEHGIDRVAILDFDLHHGNGTQAIAWRINADTVRLDLESEAKRKATQAEFDRKARKGRKSGGDSTLEVPQPKRGLKVFYGSLHDIESFPCEDGNKELITDASMCIEGAHGQWIWNIHLDAHTSPQDARRLYDEKYSQLIQKAREFFERTSSSPETSLLLISAGFDANMHEQAGMQRHGKSVPPRFYEDFTRDVVALSEEFCKGKCVSILEGGYSDRALTSGAIAHLVGLGVPDMSEELYQPSNLYQLERLAKNAFTMQQPRRKHDALSKEGVWLEYVLEAFRRVEEECGERRVTSENGGSAPVTPSRVMLDELWKSPREKRSAGRGGVSPSK